MRRKLYFLLLAVSLTACALPAAAPTLTPTASPIGTYTFTPLPTETPTQAPTETPAAPARLEDAPQIARDYIRDNPDANWAVNENGEYVITVEQNWQPPENLQAKISRMCQGPCVEDYGKRAQVGGKVYNVKGVMGDQAGNNKLDLVVKPSGWIYVEFDWNTVLNGKLTTVRARYDFGKPGDGLNDFKWDQLHISPNDGLEAIQDEFSAGLAQWFYAYSEFDADYKKSRYYRLYAQFYDNEVYRAQMNQWLETGAADNGFVLVFNGNSGFELQIQ